jgi:hypothetical protein
VKEVWKSIPGFEGSYEVSNLGRVRSLARVIMQKSRCGREYVKRVPARILRPGRKTSGHVSVVLGRKGGSHDIHILVLETFIGPCPNGMECRHKNGDPADNKLSNLVWGTRGDNIRDKKWHPRPSGYKLSGAQASSIKRQLKGGRRGVGRQLAEKYGVAECTISAIKVGRIHVDA